MLLYMVQKYFIDTVFSVIKYLNSKNAASFATQNCFNRFLDSSIIQQKCR